MPKIKIEAGNRYNENGLAWELLYFRLAAGTIKQVEKGGHLYCLTMGRIQKKGWVTMQEAKEKVSVQKALLMVGVALLVIIIGKLFLKLDTTLVLFISSTAVSIIAVLFCGTSWNKIEEQISIGIRQMGVPVIILMEIGMLVGAWMISGTIPTIMYYGMKIMNPRFFLVLTCITCSVMSVASGTSWGTLSTLGVALMGVALGLGIPLPYVAGAIVVGSFFGDKMSPLSDSTIVAAASCNVELTEHIRHMLYTTVPGYIVSLVLYLILGMQFGGGTIQNEEYTVILDTLQANFVINPIMVIPPIIVLILILMKKPCLPTFAAGIASAIVLAIVCQGTDLSSAMAAVVSGYKQETGTALVDGLLNRGGISSMLSTVGLVLAAGVFGAPIKATGAVEVIFSKVKSFAKTPRQLMILCTIMHPVFILIAVTYYVTYPVMGEMVGPIYEEYGLHKKNLTRTFEDTGTISAPLIPWGMAGAVITTTLGITPGEYWMYMPLTWMCALTGIVLAITGIGVARTDGTMITPLFRKKAKK